MEHLIPQAWFDPLATLPLLGITVVVLAILIKGADWLVEGAAGLAYRFGISKVIVGATVVSLGTTSPEAAVSVLAAWSGQAGLALGNAVGSVIADTGLIFGLGCMIAVLPADRFVLCRQGWVQFGAAMLLAAVCYGTFAAQGDAAALGRGVGIFFLCLLVGYMIISVRWSRAHPGSGTVVPPLSAMDGEGPAAEAAGLAGGPLAGRAAASIPEPARSLATAAAKASQEKTGTVPHSALRLIGQIIVGLALVVLASRVLICAVTVLASRWGVPQVVIAATLVAMGTSLPELVVGITSIVKGHKELLVGNVIGADVLNVLFVIGASATAARLPIVEAGTTVPRIFLYLHLPTMILILVLFRIYIFAASKRGRFRRWFGIPLVAIYVGYVIAQFALSVGGGSGPGVGAGPGVL